VVQLIALSSASILVSFVIAEFAVRIAYGDKFGSRPGFYVGDDRLGWKPAPDLDHTFYGPDFQIHIRTDAGGYRLGELGELDYTKELVVLCGDSFSFGWGVSTDQTFASYLDKYISEATNGRLRVANLGVGGYGIFQCYDRLSAFFETHPNTPIKLVLLQHSVNDAVDNYRSIGYHFGLWEIDEREKPRSRLHILNLVKYAAQLIHQSGQSREDVDANHPYVQDMLFAYERRGAPAKYPTTVRFEDRQIELDSVTMPTDISPAELIRREKLSRAHRDLMFESLNLSHKVGAAMEVSVVHLFISTTPDWYVREVTEIIRESAEFMKCPAVVVGRVPRPGEFDGQISNEHSGKHFTGEFNRFWAQEMSAVLRTLGAY
jgi:hypothetical protein